MSEHSENASVVQEPSEAFVLITLLNGGTLWEIPGDSRCRLETRFRKLAALVSRDMAVLMALSGYLSRRLHGTGFQYPLTRLGTVRARHAAQIQPD